MEGISCRPATLSDAAELYALRGRSILELAPQGMPIEVARQWAARGSSEGMLRRLQETEVWVAEVRGHIVGWVGVRGGDYLDALYVAPDCAKQGVGTLLLRLVEDILRHRGVAVIRADASSNAEDFYTRRGYEPFGPRPPEDARPMRKGLLEALPNLALHQTAVVLSVNGRG